MKITKKLLITFILVATMLVGMIPAYAAVEKTTQQKAEALNALKIVTGTNGQYNLDSQLRRSEAVTYMIRLIGKAGYVIQNASLYSTTPFTDVASNQWYAPYIGYGSESGLISSGTTQFRPLDFILEKDFLRLALIALEFREGIDFTSDNIFDKAREAGLINLTFYIGHINQNIITTRSTAVDILYNALALKVRTGDKLLCQKLVEEGAATTSQLASLGFIEDKPVSEILEISTVDRNKLEIKFNEDIAFVSGIKVYEKADDDEVLDHSIQSLAGNTLTLKVNDLDLTKDYTVELTGVQDESGNVVEKLKDTFEGFETEERESNFFRISKIEPVNERSIVVYFTHPVSINSEVCLYYSILKDNKVVADGKQGFIRAGMMNSEDNAVLLSLNTGVLDDGALYTLKIDGFMTSAYGVTLNNGGGDSMKFVAESDETEKFELQEIIPIDKKTVLLHFNKEVNSFLAGQVFNFYLTDEDDEPIRILSTAMHDSGTGVYLNLSEAMTKDDKYNLTINNLNDITKQEYITEQSFTFEADYGTTEDFEIRDTNTINNQTVEVVLNRPLNPTTAVNPDYYTIRLTSGRTSMTPVKVYYNPSEDAYRVKLYLGSGNTLSSKNTYEVIIDSDMKDYLGNSVSAVGDKFKGSNSDNKDAAIDTVVPVSTDSVKITFTKEIAFNAANLSPSNFIMEYSYNINSIKKIPIGVLYVDARTVVLRFDSLDYDTEYTIKIVELLDYLGKTVKGLNEEFKLEAEE